MKDLWNTLYLNWYSFRFVNYEEVITRVQIPVLGTLDQGFNSSFSLGIFILCFSLFFCKLRKQLLGLDGEDESTDFASRA